MIDSPIIALDFSSDKQVLDFVSRIEPKIAILKVGSILFTRYGPDLVRTLITQGFRIFLDLKFHDIPNTVSGACKAAADLGVWMLNVHVVGGVAMIEAARHAVDAYGESKPLLIGVTVLTSLEEGDLCDIASPLDAYILKLATLGQHAGLDGVVCAAMDVPSIKKVCGASFLTVTPGIRFSETAQHDQKRWVTPQEAYALGSDYLVVGRAITEHPHPMTILSQWSQDRNRET